VVAKKKVTADEARRLLESRTLREVLE
jgi:hypothetical protein